MIKIENTDVTGWEAAIRGMRNPKNSWDRSDSGICRVNGEEMACVGCSQEGDCMDGCDIFILGINDLDLMTRLAKGGPVHAKYRRYIDVYVDVTAPLYFWKEFETYRTVVADNPFDIEMNSCSTMHKIHAKEFELEDFSHDKLSIEGVTRLEDDISYLEYVRECYLRATDTKQKEAYWYEMIQLLPSSYNQKRTLKLNYEVLSNMYRWRKNHKLEEWRLFCQWIEELPYSEIITCKEDI